MCNYVTYIKGCGTFMRRAIRSGNRIFMTRRMAAASAAAVLLSLSAKADSLPPAPEPIYSHEIPVKLWGVTQLRECVFAVGSSEPDKVVTGKVSLAGDVEFDFQNGRSLLVRAG